MHGNMNVKFIKCTVCLFWCAILWNSLRNAPVAFQSIESACNTRLVSLCLFMPYFLAVVIHICYVKLFDFASDAFCLCNN